MAIGKIDGVLMEAGSIGVGYDNDGHATMWFISPGARYKEIVVLKRLYPAEFYGSGSQSPHSIDPHFIERFAAVATKRKAGGDARFAALRPVSGEGFGGVKECRIDLIDTDEDWLKEVGVFDRGQGNLKALKDIKKAVDGRSKGRISFLDGLFEN